MWSLTKVLVFSSVAIAGSGGGGWAIYRALKEDVEAVKKERVKWDSKLDILKQELIKLRTGNNDEYSTLTKKIAPNERSTIFDLNNENNAFQSDKKDLQRKALSDFCKNDEKKQGIREGLLKIICE
ncbi:hypothetical protein A6V39_05300 [Candidatus Mycoplasma haematobovis]|uniref:Uncharacterized protein n=1 Tax=Candidatus Mycoplasma haematobovis TaxID=432608 RepID=A0A1A9QCK9_9MOLU|nr:hypothetical protein [Candidatus Mycoplasma haematobovis]OAL09751.1 hypothetical protein A6V39_05300 [Candidatus Mycoplasma haematobovis]